MKDVHGADWSVELGQQFLRQVGLPELLKEVHPLLFLMTGLAALTKLTCHPV